MGRRRRIRLAGPVRKQPAAVRIFKGDARAAMVRKVMDRLRGWRLSPFEFEGATHAGIRVALVLDGHPWGASDQEAGLLVREALHLLGAKRPSWIEGQHFYSLARENCMNCRGPLDEEDIANHRRFCCDECATSARMADETLFLHAMRLSYYSAYYVATKEAMPPKPCQWCGRSFQPSVPDAETCSTECREKLHTARQPRRDCAHCGKTFQPRKHHAKFCSRECTIEAQTAANAAKRANERGERSCPGCLSVFRPRRSDQSFCSPQCRNRTSARASKQRRKAEEKAAGDFLCEEVKEAA
jgi:hypothetical protein